MTPEPEKQMQMKPLTFIRSEPITEGDRGEVYCQFLEDHGKPGEQYSLTQDIVLTVMDLPVKTEKGYKYKMSISEP